MTSARQDHGRHAAWDDDPLLTLIRHRYAYRWRVFRTEHLWIATAVDYWANHAPTLVEPDVEHFVRQLENPPPRSGGRSLLSAGWFASQLDEIGDGVYRDHSPPATEKPPGAPFPSPSGQRAATASRYIVTVRSDRPRARRSSTKESMCGVKGPASRVREPRRVLLVATSDISECSQANRSYLSRPRSRSSEAI